MVFCNDTIWVNFQQVSRSHKAPLVVSWVISFWTTCHFHMFISGKHPILRPVNPNVSTGKRNWLFVLCSKIKMLFASLWRHLSWKVEFFRYLIFVFLPETSDVVTGLVSISPTTVGSPLEPIHHFYPITAHFRVLTCRWQPPGPPSTSGLSNRSVPYSPWGRVCVCSSLNCTSAPTKVYKRGCLPFLRLTFW